MFGKSIFISSYTCDVMIKGSFLLNSTITHLIPHVRVLCYFFLFIQYSTHRQKFLTQKYRMHQYSGKGTDSFSLSFNNCLKGVTCSNLRPYFRYKRDISIQVNLQQSIEINKISCQLSYDFHVLTYDAYNKSFETNLLNKSMLLFHQIKAIIVLILQK